MKSTMIGVSPLQERTGAETGGGQERGQERGQEQPAGEGESSTEVGVPAFDPPNLRENPRHGGSRQESPRQPEGRFARTMMGVGLRADTPQSGALAMEYAPAKGSTMLGGADGTGSGSTAASSAAAVDYAPAKGRTMLGVPDAAAISGAVRRAAANNPEQYSQLAGDVPGDDTGDLGGGGPAEVAGQVTGDADPEASYSAPAERLSGRGGTGTAPGNAPAPQLHFEHESASDYHSGSSVPSPPRRTTGLLYLAGLLAVGLFAAAFWLWQGQRSSSDVQVSVVAGESGEAMMFRVLDAPSGTTVEFGDQEQPLKSGEARFPLSQDSLVVGDNVVPATIVYPDGESLSLRVPLHVDYRLFVDTAPLRAGKASVDVVIAASDGTRVLLDGEEIALDDQGRGIQSHPVDVVEGGRAGVIDHVVKYRVEPRRGEPIIGELSTKIPVTMLQLDSPGRTVVTDGTSVQLAGAVAKGTTITVDEAPIRVNEDGRFLHILRLPEPGHYTPRVVAQAPEKAPLAITLDVTRVKDLEAAAAAFNADSSLTYDLIAQNPAMYKGQRVDFDGRVFNAKTENGRGVLQMLVRDCAQGRQCSLWVTYPALSRVSNDSWVRVLGTVAGQQQFRSQRDEIVTVPKVEAIFLLPSKP